MGKSISSIISQAEFTQTVNLDEIPDTKGIFIIVECPLTDTNPSKWSCTLIEKGSSDTLKSTILKIVTSEELAIKHNNLAYFFAANLSPKKYQEILEDISQVHITG